VVGEAAVERETDDAGLVRAPLRVPGPALLAVTAPEHGLDRIGDAVDHPAELVPERGRDAQGDVTEVAPADARRPHVDQHVVRAVRGRVRLVDLQDHRGPVDDPNRPHDVTAITTRRGPRR